MFNEVKLIEKTKKVLLNEKKARQEENDLCTANDTRWGFGGAISRASVFHIYSNFVSWILASTCYPFFGKNK